MATLLSSLETSVRVHLNAPAATDLFWTSSELIALLNQGSKDLWKAIKDLFQKHHYTFDQTNVSIEANATSLTGVPTDVHDVYFIRARTPADYPSLKFRKADYGSDEFAEALAQTAADATNAGEILYDILSAGAPVSAPIIKVAPPVSGTILLELGYVPTIGDQTSAQNNPIPGESDAALIAYAVAWAMAKQRADKSPDPTWLAIYGTEKQNLCTSLTPRDQSEPEVVSGMFEGWD